jgi:hypothetical protein
VLVVEVRELVGLELLVSGGEIPLFDFGVRMVLTLCRCQHHWLTTFEARYLRSIIAHT